MAQGPRAKIDGVGRRSNRHRPNAAADAAARRRRRRRLEERRCGARLPPLCLGAWEAVNEAEERLFMPGGRDGGDGWGASDDRAPATLGGERESLSFALSSLPVRLVLLLAKGPPPRPPSRHGQQREGDPQGARAFLGPQDPAGAGGARTKPKMESQRGRGEQERSKRERLVVPALSRSSRALPLCPRSNPASARGTRTHPSRRACGAPLRGGGVVVLFVSFSRSVVKRRRRGR